VFINEDRVVDPDFHHPIFKSFSIQGEHAMHKLITFVVLFCSVPAFAADCPPLLDRTMTTLQGEPINLCKYAGKPILVVNTASKCGFAPQFDKLESMYGKYQQRGLVVIGFPSNDFHQELAKKEEIASYCKVTYGVKFPMMEPSSVKGKEANGLFKALFKITGTEPSWNFHKYLIAPNGRTVYSFETPVEPDSMAILGKIETMLNTVPVSFYDPYFHLHQLVTNQL